MKEAQSGKFQLVKKSKGFERANFLQRSSSTRDLVSLEYEASRQTPTAWQHPALSLLPTCKV